MVKRRSWGGPSRAPRASRRFSRGVLDRELAAGADVVHAENVVRMLGLATNETAGVARRPIPGAGVRVGRRREHPESTVSGLTLTRREG